MNEQKPAGRSSRRGRQARETSAPAREVNYRNLCELGHHQSGSMDGGRFHIIRVGSNIPDMWSRHRHDLTAV